MHKADLQGLLPVLVSSGPVSTVKPSVVPGIDRTCKNQGGKSKTLGSKSDDQNEGDSVHSNISFNFDQKFPACFG